MFKTVANVPEERAWNKSSHWFFWLEEVQRHQESVGNCLPTFLFSKLLLGKDVCYFSKAVKIETTENSSTR